MMYKYWMYYYNNELYAYTDNSDYAILFENMRDMKKIKKIKRKINKDEVNWLAHNFQTSILGIMEFDIYDNNIKIKGKKIIVVTDMEKITIVNESFKLKYQTLSLLCWENPSLFKDKLRKALHILEYDVIYNNLCKADTKVMLDDNKIEPRLEVDTFALFVHYFGKTLKG